jgi:hypothetical protein
MSVFDFSRLEPQKYFFTLGINESLSGGLNAGFGTRFGKVYFGVAYGGSLIGEAIRLIPSQTLIDDISDNTLNVLIGTGILGLNSVFRNLCSASICRGKLSGKAA